jgi:hypothetical protein
MSTTIKAILLAIFFISTQVQTVKADELKTVSVKEFLAKKDSKKIIAQNLSEYEINNDEMIVLYKIKSDNKQAKKRLSLNKKVKPVIIASLK